MTLYYSQASALQAIGETMPSGSDVGYLFLTYFKRTLEENPERPRQAMITNGDGTYDYAYGVYQADGTYTDVSITSGLSGVGWETDLKGLSGNMYVVSMTRDEFEEFVDMLEA